MQIIKIGFEISGKSNILKNAVIIEHFYQPIRMMLSEVLICGLDRINIEMKFPTRPGMATTTNKTRLMTNSKSGR